MASLALGAAALPAEADASGQPENVRLGYEVYFSGLHILSVDAELETSDEKYRLKVSSATQGMTDFFVGWKGESETSGLFAGSAAVPQGFRNRGVWKGDPRLVEIDYSASGDVTSYKVEPEPDPDEVTRLPDNAEVGTSDPLTVIALVTKEINRGATCSGSFPVFDGKRRYDVTISPKAPEFISPNDYSIYSGQALACGLDLKILGGDRKEKSKYAETARNRVVYVARPLENAPAVPVRLQIETDYGTLMAHLTRFETGDMKLRQTANR